MLDTTLPPGQTAANFPNQRFFWQLSILSWISWGEKSHSFAWDQQRVDLAPKATEIGVAIKR
jgi:hypothetical protein